MKEFVSLAVGVLWTITATEASPTKINGMYVNTFGDPSKQSLIFIHGGPGYNSRDFEVSSGQALADQGYYVVVYDQRGQGRSQEVDPEQFNYAQYADDLKTIVDTLDLNKPVLIGHSHGGAISIKFDQKYPGVAKSIVLLAAPLNMWGTMHSLLSNCAMRYEQTGRTQKQAEVAYIYGQLFLNPELPVDHIPGYVSAAFMHGIDCGLYNMKNPTAEALGLKDKLKKNPIQGPLSGQTTAVSGFIASESYLHNNFLEYAYNNRSRFCGIYGDEDGLFTPLELALIRNSLQMPGEPERYALIRGSSHTVYVDQQTQFFQSLKATCGL